MVNKTTNIFIGILTSIIIAIISINASAFFGKELLGFNKSPISPIFLSLLSGIIVANFTKMPLIANIGIEICIKYFLKAGIILMGIRLGINDMLSFGLKGILVITPCIILTIIVVEKTRSYFSIPSKMATLIGVGTSICGATAIVATGPVIHAKKEEIAFAIVNITIFGIFAMLFYPFLAHFFFSSNPISAGLFLGSSIHETAQVAGAGMIYADQFFSSEAFDTSTVTKLVRNTFMIIVIPYFSIQNNKLNGLKTNFSKQVYQIFPLFILGFIFFVILRTIGDYNIEKNGSIFGLINFETWTMLIDTISRLSKFLLIIAMSAIGISINIKKLRSIGFQIFYYGLFISAFVGLVSIGTIHLIF